MKVSEINNGLSFTQSTKNSNNKKKCCPQPKCNACSYGSLMVKNAIMELALKDASRIIAQDMYVKSKNK